MRKIFLFLLVIYFTKSSEACSCPPFHPQNTYCEADFVIKGQPIDVFYETDPLSVEELPSDPEELFNYDGFRYRYYVISITKDFKTLLPSGETRVIRIPGRSGDCGFQLYKFGETRKQWLLTGRWTGGYGTTHWCWFNSPWEDVSGKQKDYLNNGIYRNNCDCLVAHCYEDPFLGCTPDPVPDNACVHYEPSRDDCYVRDLACKTNSRGRRRRGDDSCIWRGPKKNDCVSNNPDS